MRSTSGSQASLIELTLAFGPGFTFGFGACHGGAVAGLPGVLGLVGVVGFAGAGADPLAFGPGFTFGLGACHGGAVFGLPGVLGLVGVVGFAGAGADASSIWSGSCVIIEARYLMKSLSTWPMMRS